MAPRFAGVNSDGTYLKEWCVDKSPLNGSKIWAGRSQHGSEAVNGFYNTGEYLELSHPNSPCPTPLDPSLKQNFVPPLLYYRVKLG